VSVLVTPAILLRSHPYSDSSQILRFYSRDAGVVAMVGKGVRKLGGKHGASLSTFAEGPLTFYHRENRDLQTYKDFSSQHPRLGISRDPLRLAGASVLGEVVLQHAGADGNPELFQKLSRGLDRMDSDQASDFLLILLTELWGLVEELGYAPEVSGCVLCGREFREGELGRFDFAVGGVRCPDCLEGGQGPRLGPTARAQLLGLLRGDLDEKLIRPRAHLRLVSDFITYHISGGTPLRSMDVLATMVPKDHA
jgi:DNA repair protein RecO (recombination protein O)